MRQAVVAASLCRGVDRVASARRQSAVATTDHLSPAFAAPAWQADHRSLEMFAPAKISTGEAAALDEVLVKEQASA